MKGNKNTGIVKQKRQDDVILKKEHNQTYRRTFMSILGMGLFIIGMIITSTIVTDVYMADTYYNRGIFESMNVILLEKEIPNVRKECTDEQYNNLVNAYNNIKEATFNNSRISLKMARAYNRALRESGISNYELYQIAAYARYLDGLKDGIKCRVYNDVVKELYNGGIIPEEDYDTFSIMYDEKFLGKEEVSKIINYAEQLIQQARNNDALNGDLLFKVS